MREINVSEITNKIKNMCISVNLDLSDDMKSALKQAEQEESSTLGKHILRQLDKNLEIASSESESEAQAESRKAFRQLWHL